MRNCGLNEWLHVLLVSLMCTAGVKGAFCLKRKLFERAMEGKLEQMSQGVPVSKDSLLSRIAFKKAREVLGQSATFQHNPPVASFSLSSFKF